jgi:hypothetical protein
MIYLLDYQLVLQEVVCVVGIGYMKDTMAKVTRMKL